MMDPNTTEARELQEVASEHDRRLQLRLGLAGLQAYMEREGYNNLAARQPQARRGRLDHILGEAHGFG